ncbi:hypothetical protein ES705_26307 [subsurface metagenome]
MLRIKYLLPLILILLLSFTLIGDCWVAGYDQRIKLTTDHTKIDDTLTNFPVTAFFTAAQAEEIFAEFDADEDFDRGQFALGDDTLLKAEKELFDHSESLGIYHFKSTELSPSAGTDIYFYYDNDADHNTSYIGIIGSATAAEVWDEWFSLVVHGVDNTTSSVLDSTSTNNDVTKSGANAPLEVTGKVGKGQDFERNSGHYATIGAAARLIPQKDITVTVCIKPETITHETIHATIYVQNDNSVLGYVEHSYYINRAEGKPFYSNYLRDDGYLSANTALTINEWEHIGFTRSTNTLTHYKAGVADGSGTVGTCTVTEDIDNTLMGARYYDGAAAHEFDGIMDEMRVSDIVRSAAWIKATYNSLWDTLLTYGSEETAEAPVTNIMFMFSNF